MKYTILKCVNPNDGYYFQCNEYFFEAIQGHWVLMSICKKTLPFEVDA